MNESKSAKSTVRMPRRAMLLLGGVVAATSILAGAGPASAGPGFPGPIIIAHPDSPTTASCTLATAKCAVEDKNRIDRVIRYKDSGQATATVLIGGPTQTTVVNTDSMYVKFEVIDKLGYRRMFQFPVNN